jgi:hypothetical protein
MSIARPLSRFTTATALWRRAPLWRFTLLSTALLLLLAALFPPHVELHSGPALPPVISEASYTPPPHVAALPTVSPSPVPDALRAQTGQASTTQAPSASAPYDAPAAAAPPPAATSPQTAPAPARLSLATPNNQPAPKNGAGIDTALIGRTYQHELLMDGFKVPLPQGDWAVLASFNIWVVKSPQNKGMSYFLGRIEKGRLAGAMVVNALRSPAEAPTGFDEFKNCANPDNIYTSKEEIVPFDHQACWVMHSMFTPPWQQWGDKAMQMDNIVRAAAGDLAAKGVTYPQDLVAVHFYRSEKWGVLNATYLFSPEQDGIKSDVAPSFRDSDWFGPNVQRYPEKVLYTNKLKTWGASFWPRFKAAFDAGR